ncbi:MAG: type II secretion system protein GspN [Proteobacteria bacterium]|nr:type II secretion system protein GspN [Pseudomonadota bacterium]
MKVIRTIFSWRTILYLAYALILTGLLLYVRFPTKKFTQFCENRLELIFPESDCNIDRIIYQFPSTLTFNGVSLRRSGVSGDPGFFVDRLSVTADLPKLMSNITLAVTFYGGALSARLEVDAAAKRIEMHDIRLAGLDVAGLQKDLVILDRKVSGKLGFTGSYQAAFENLAGGTGKGQVVVDAGSVELMQPVLSLQQIDFYQVVCNLRYENRKLLFSEGTLNGKDLTADFTGELQAVSSFLASEMQFGGRLIPQAIFLEIHPQEKRMVQGLMKRYNMTALPFKIGGTLSSPTFRFST